MATRKSEPREAMLRFVRGPDGTLGFDVASSMPHRGAWTVSERGAVVAAVSRGGFARAFDAPVLADGEALAAEVEATLEREALHGLGLLRRSGQVSIGQDELAEARETGRLRAVVAARDLSDRSRRVAESAGAPVVVGPVMERLGEALGRGPTGLCGILGQGMLGQGILGQGSLGQETTGQETTGQQTTGQGSLRGAHGEGPLGARVFGNFDRLARFRGQKQPNEVDQREGTAA